MAFNALIPYLSLAVSAAVNGEILSIMIECGWRPGILGMTAFTIGWEYVRLVIWIGGLVVISRMAPKTSVWCVVIVSVVALGTIAGNGGMRALKNIITVMIRELCRTPPWFCCMACGTVGAKR